MTVSRRTWNETVSTCHGALEMRLTLVTYTQKYAGTHQYVSFAYICRNIDNLNLKKL